MNPDCDFHQRLHTLSERVLQNLSQRDGVSAWEIKLELKAPYSVLLLALGALLQDGKIRITPHARSYTITRPDAVPHQPLEI